MFLRSINMQVDIFPRKNPAKYPSFQVNISQPNLNTLHKVHFNMNTLWLIHDGHAKVMSFGQVTNSNYMALSPLGKFFLFSVQQFSFKFTFQVSSSHLRKKVVYQFASIV